jgi:uncharacterized membrane protein (Fun14 family)
MKKVRGFQLLFGAAGLMVLGFCIHIWVDWLQYDAITNSAPFGVWIFADAVLWLIPAALAFAAGWVSKKKVTRKEK